MKKQKLNYSSSGFSLLEILIATTILGFVMMVIVSAVRTSFDSNDKVLKEDESLLQVETLFARMDWDFSQIYTPLFFSTKFKLPTNNKEGTPVYNPLSFYQQNEQFNFPTQEGVPVPNFKNPEKGVFEFLTSSNRKKAMADTQSYYSWIRYAARAPTAEEQKQEEDLGPLIIVRLSAAENPYQSGRINWDKVKAQVMLTKVEEMEFSFWDAKKKKFVAPLTDVDEGEHLLLGMQLKLKWRDPKGNSHLVNKTFRPIWPIFTPPDPSIAESNPSSGTEKKEEGNKKTSPDESNPEPQGTDT